MIPLRDDIPTHCVPWVNYGIIIACVLVYLLQLQSPGGGEQMIFQYGMVPAEVTGLPSAPLPPGLDEELRGRIPPPAVTPWATVLTCIFLHGGLLHLLGNMLFLYIFGDNVEDRYGHFGYLAMYLACGVSASLFHLWSAPASPIPTVGASGAIAGVMGSYMLMFRHARVMTLIPLGIFTQLVAVPAPFFLGLWFVLQLVSATGGATEGAGVAFWAHVGGFVVGVGLTWLLMALNRLHPHASQIHHAPAFQRRQLPWY